MRMTVQPAALSLRSRTAVVFEGVAGAVVLPAVEFDDEAAVRPREVDLVSFDEDVGLGPRETAVIEEGVEAGLEVSSGVGWWGERAEGSACLAWSGGVW